jgi:protocatechuate 4,5-dioxygenase alpha chain
MAALTLPSAWEDDMSLDYFNPLLRSNDLVQDLKWDNELRARFESAERDVLASYPLTDDERTAISQRDFRRLYELGLHPYLLSQLARLIYGTGEKAGTSAAATALVESLLGSEYQSYLAARGE